MNAPVEKLSVLSNVESRSAHLIKWLYSGIYCAITFIVLHYLGYAISCANAHYLGFEPTFSFEGLSSLRHTSGWGPRSIAFVYLAPAAFGFGVSAVAMFAAFQLSLLRTHVRNFMFWLSINGYLLFYSFFFFGLIGVEHRLTDFYGSYAAVFDWLYWSHRSSYIVLAVSSVFFLVVGLLFAPLILSFNHSQSITLHKRANSVIFTNIVLIPFFVGMVIVLAASFPMDAKLLGVRVISAIPLFLISFLSMNLIPDGNVLIVRGGLTKMPWLKVSVLAIILIIVTRFLFTLSIG